MQRGITPQNALKLSAWIAAVHPDLFRQLVGQVNSIARTPNGRLGRFGYFGDDADLSSLDFTPDLPTYMPDPSTNIDLSSIGDNISLQDVSFDPSTAGVDDLSSSAITSAIAAPSAPDSSLSGSSDSSGSFWSSVGSGVSSVASSVGKVAAALLSPQVVSSVANAASSYFKSQATTAQAQAQAQTQQAVLNAQLARVAAGGAPAPISYVRNPVTGAMTPVYASNTGLQPVTSNLLSSLLTPQAGGVSIAGISGTGWMIGGAVLLLVIALSRSN